MVVNLWAPRTQPPTLFAIRKAVLNYAMSLGTYRSHKIRRHCRQNTHTRTQGNLYDKPHYFQKESKGRK